MPSLSSDQVNYLIWRYFQEEGLSLSAFSLNKETSASEFDAERAKTVADGDLVKLLLKGIQTTEIEAAAGNIEAINELKASGNIAINMSDIPSGERDGDATETHTSDTTTVSANALPSTSKTSAIQVTGLERVVVPDDKIISGGVDCVFNSPWALMLAGDDAVVTYMAMPNDACHKVMLECQDTPTRIEPLGENIVGPDHCVLVGYGSGCVRQWRFSDKSVVMQSCLNPPSGNSGPVLTVKSSPMGTRAAVANVKTGVVNVWDLCRRQLLYQLDDPSEDCVPVGDVLWMGGDTTIAVACAAGVAIYRLPESATAHNTPASDASPASPSASISSATMIRPTKWLKAHSKPVGLLAFEQVTQLLASGGDDGQVCVWNAQGTEPVRQLEVGYLTAPISHVSWLGIHLLTSSTDGAVRLWDTRQQPLRLIASVDVGEPVYTLQVSKHMPTHVAVLTPEGVKVYILDQQQNFRVAGEVKATGVQCMTWGSDPSLAVSTRKETVIVRCLSR